MLDYRGLKAFSFPVVVQEYDERDALLYALALGLGADPLDPRGLRYVYERDAQVLPTFSAVLGAPGMWTREHPELGIAYEQMVHGEHRIQFHRPLPLKAKITGRSRIGRVVDKGVGRGAIVEVIRTVHDSSTDDLLATMDYLLFCRGDGGFSAEGQASDAPREPLTPTPESDFNLSVEWQTRPDAALIYRLAGDMNSLHADPEVAARAGFRQPILHGLATFAMAGAALLRAFCDNDSARLLSLACRFSAPVYPGELLQIQAWIQDHRIAFRVRVPERNVFALTHGSAEISIPG